MFKYILAFLFIILIFSSLSLFAQEFNIVEDDLEIETSIILLNFYKDDQVIISNYFFEILNFEEENYILIPINMFSNQIDLEIIYDRLSNLLKIKNPDNDKVVQIDLTNRKYIDFNQWDNEPPIIYSNDFFVSSKVISYLLDSDIEWRPNYQELAITGDFDGEVIQDLSIDPDEKKKIVETEKENIYKLDDRFRIGSINYKVITDYRNSNFYPDSLSFKEVISVFGRVNNWALSLREEAKYEVFDKNIEYDIPLIKAKYRDDHKLIILGDTSFNFKNTVGENILRGLYFRIPEKLSIKVVPMINIEGETDANAEVELYVNNKFIKKYKVNEDGKYQFDNVIINLKILNRIMIVIVKPDGEKEIIDKKITAVEKILKEGSREFEFVAGQYKKESSSQDYDGLLAGFRGGIALNEDLSFNAEATYYNKEYIDEGEYISSNAGLAYRLLDNTIVSIDWYYGNYDGENTNGYKFNLHYAFNRGYLDGYYFYIPKYLSELIPDNSGKEQKIMGVINLNQNWAIEPTIGVYESLDLDFPQKNKYIKVRLRRTNGWENYLALLGSYEIIEKNYFLTIGNVTYSLPGENNQYGAGVDFRMYRQGFKLTTSANIYDNNISLPSNITLTHQNINYSIDLYKLLTNKLLITGNYRTEYDNYSGEIKNNDIEAEARIRYNFYDNNYLTLMGRKSDLETQDIEEQRYSASINSYLTDNIDIYGEYSVVKSSSLYNYNEIKVDSSYNLNNSGYINVFANYVMPEDQYFSTHFGYGAGYSYIFDNFNELEIEAGKNYESVLDSEFEYYFTVSFAQAFSYTKDKILKSRFSNSEHRSFVAGYVYLDENNNGIYDKGEETLPNIEMRLDNVVVRTDKYGLYRFNPLFSDTYILNFNYRTLFADYTPITEEKIIKVRENENIFINFGLTLNGSISGKIFLDKNNNGILDDNEEPLSWVGVSLDGVKYDYTDERGEFYFENIALGSHEVKIIKESIPSSLEVAGELTNHIYITKDNLDISNMIFPLYYKF